MKAAAGAWDPGHHTADTPEPPAEEGSSGDLSSLAGSFAAQAALRERQQGAKGAEGSRGAPFLPARPPAGGAGEERAAAGAPPPGSPLHPGVGPVSTRALRHTLGIELDHSAAMERCRLLCLPLVGACSSPAGRAVLLTVPLPPGLFCRRLRHQKPSRRCQESPWTWASRLVSAQVVWPKQSPSAESRGQQPVACAAAAACAHPHQFCWRKPRPLADSPTLLPSLCPGVGHGQGPSAELCSGEGGARARLRLALLCA